MALHVFAVRDLMADWGWGFTCPQPLHNPLLRRAKCNFQPAIQKKETEVSPRLTNFVLRYVLSINLTANKTAFALQAYSALNYNRQWLGILLPENANKLIRQYIPKGTDFSTISSALIRIIQYKINRRPRKKQNFDCPKNVIFRQLANFALAR